MTCYFPPQTVVEEKFLDILYAQASPVQMAVLYNRLADSFGLSRWERRGVRGDPKGSPWEYLVRQARKNLADKGWVYCPIDGRWALTEAGLAEMRRHTADQPTHA
jgi:hypothetical protein